ncbi:MAG: ATP-binding protein [Myxococcota bacterium]
MDSPTFAFNTRLEGIPADRLLEALSRIHPWILVIDEQRRVLWVSEGLSDLDGLDDFRPGVDARSFLSRLPRPEQVFPLRSSLRGRSHLESVPLELRASDGRPIDVDLDLVRIDSEAGDLLFVIATESTAKVESGLDAEIVELVPEALLAIDAAGFVRRANAAACRLLEVEAEQILARPVTTLLAQGVQDLESLTSLLTGPTCVESASLELRGASGEQATLEATVRPLSDGHLALLLRRPGQADSVDLQRAHDELEHCIGGLAHDLRSPLVSLLGFSRLLRQDYESVLDDTGRHFVDRIETAARSMESLIHDLLELARISEPEVEPIPVDPSRVIAEVASALAPRLEEAGIELVVPESSELRVHCERPRLYQVFSNLIGNAVEHMGPMAHPRIEVRVDSNESGHEIVVSDNGRGIDPADHGRIFEIFQSLGKRSARHGTGMGLAIVKKIAEKRGGRVWVESDSGKGARFHVSFPTPQASAP